MLKQLMSGPPLLRLAVAESMTGGRLQALVTAESGASGYFLGGVTAYALEQKVRLLRVDEALATRVDCVSAEVAWQMASGVAALFDAEVAAATTGYAEPNPDRGFVAPGVFWALCHRGAGGAVVRREGFITLPGLGRTEAQQQAAAVVMAELVSFVRGLRGFRC